MDSSSNTSDIAFVGSGISSSFTVLHFLDLLKGQKCSGKTKITLIDKYPEFHTGIPYGSRSGFTVLLITSLANFLPEPELSEFILWLNANKNWLLQEFKEEGGELSKEWLANHGPKIEQNEWADLFIPRRFFGHYIDLRVKNKISELENHDLIEMEYVTSKVTDLEKNSDSWRFLLENENELFSKKVVLAVGSLPTQYLWRKKKLIKENNLLFINDPYRPDLRKTLDRVKKFLKKRKRKKNNVVIVGANASGLELLYKLNDYSNIKSRIHRFTLLSTQGLLPDSIMDLDKLKKYRPINLISLQSKKHLTAKIIAEATFKDLESADAMNLGAASTVGVISKIFGDLLEKLQPKELENFACHYGNEIGRKQRCAGAHYSNTVHKLNKMDRFGHIAGRFSDMKEHNDGYLLEYLDTETGQHKFLEEPVNIVINCIGGMHLTNSKIPVLLKNLINKNYVTPNESRIGFQVNKNLEASPNLHIIGPLLAGNVIENKAVWHVEHCGRIIGLSKIVAEKLINSNFSNKSNDTIRLSVLNLEKIENRKQYQKTISREWNNNPYYVYEYFSHHKNDTSELIVFELKSGEESLAIMPMVKRTIPNTDNKYFDIISPYGYSGPLFKENLDSAHRCLFWKKVDDWYRGNNIITEFIRFDLEGNYKNYSGSCTATLRNVNGKLLNNFEDQWGKFLPKVRNNYRKALNHNLLFKVFNKEEITEKEIQVFYDLYVDTMKRNNAAKFLYFSLEYFKNLVLNHPGNFTLVFVYYGKEAISTELIINKGDLIHAYLGGTLAKYFNHRPNDFLRVEVLKWAILNHKKHYVLGGGIKDNDGLYKHKKSLFPKDGDQIFYTGRKVIDGKVYESLNKEAERVNGDTKEIDFFPFYRNLNEPTKL